MSGDFIDDDGSDFFAGDDMPQAGRPLGLVVGVKARVIFGPKGEVIYDELAAWERAYRAQGRPAITFEEEAAE